MDSAIRDFVRRRAGGNCEYCLFPQEFSKLSHHIEHIVAKQHGGSDDLDNLALASHRCNLAKGPNLSGGDPLSGHTTPLFHPRGERWNDHFFVRGALIEGSTPTGRATIQVFAMNDARRLEARSALLPRSRLN
jgi:5-methylcytosine-specific restriction endonuclease McrA